MCFMRLSDEGGIVYQTHLDEDPNVHASPPSHIHRSETLQQFRHLTRSLYLHYRVLEIPYIASYVVFWAMDFNKGIIETWVVIPIAFQTPCYIQKEGGIRIHGLY